MHNSTTDPNKSSSSIVHVYVLVLEYTYVYVLDYCNTLRRFVLGGFAAHVFRWRQKKMCPRGGHELPRPRDELMAGDSSTWTPRARSVQLA